MTSMNDINDWHQWISSLNDIDEYQWMTSMNDINEWYQWHDILTHRHGHSCRITQATQTLGSKHFCNTGTHTHEHTKEI